MRNSDLIMSCSFSYRPLILLMLFQIIFANWDQFLDNHDMDGSLVSIFEEAQAAEDLFLNVGDAFAYSEFADEDRWDNNVLSSCSHNSNWQPSKLRARDAFCPADSSPPLRIPELPDFSDIDNAINVPDIEILVVAEELTRPDKPYLVIVVSDVSISANEPEYYCHKYLARSSVPSLFSVPVCSEYNSWWTMQYGVYSEISPATLREFS